MKHIFTLTLSAITLTMLFAVTDLNAQTSKAQATKATQDTKIGLTVGLDYVNNYLYRGQYYYTFGTMFNDGMFSQYAFYNIFDTGLSVGIKGEIMERWVWNEKEELLPGMTPDVNCIDFNINYMYKVDNIVTFSLGGWYYRYKTIHNKDAGVSFNMSYFDFYFSAEVDALPLSLRLAITYSYYMDDNYVRGPGSGGWAPGPGGWGYGSGKNGDLYIQFGLGHSLKIINKTYFDLDATAGFLNQNSYVFNLETTKSADISDIDLSVGITTTGGILTLSASVHYIIVPGTQYKYTHVYSSDEGRWVYAIDIHRFYAKFGVSCNI